MSTKLIKIVVVVVNYIKKIMPPLQVIVLSRIK